MWSGNLGKGWAEPGKDSSEDHLLTGNRGKHFFSWLCLVDHPNGRRSKTLGSEFLSHCQKRAFWRHRIQDLRTSQSFCWSLYRPRLPSPWNCWVDAIALRISIRLGSSADSRGTRSQLPLYPSAKRPIMTHGAQAGHLNCRLREVHGPSALSAVFVFARELGLSPAGLSWTRTSTRGGRRPRPLALYWKEQKDWNFKE